MILLFNVLTELEGHRYSSPPPHSFFYLGGSNSIINVMLHEIPLGTIYTFSSCEMIIKLLAVTLNATCNMTKLCSQGKSLSFAHLCCPVYFLFFENVLTMSSLSFIHLSLLTSCIKGLG